MKRFLFYLTLFILLITPAIMASQTDELLKQAVELIKIDKLDWALELVREVIQKDPHNPKSYHCAGMIYFKKKNYPLSIKEYKIALSFKPDYSVAWYNLGLSYEKSAKYKEACEAFTKARDLYKEQNNKRDYEDAIKKLADLQEMGYVAPSALEVKETEMVLIEGGEFFMGSNRNGSGTDEKPGHKVYLSSYRIDKYEVTNSQYCKFLNDKGKEKNDGLVWIHINDRSGECKIKKIKKTYMAVPGYENHPVTFVTWYGATAYAKWMNKRLPTEAEWEKAARGTDGRIFPWGNNWDSGRCANKENSTDRKTKPAGSYPYGASPYGVMDMAGNVLEWCSDWYGYYPVMEEPVKNPLGPFSGVTKILRGGSWDDDYYYCRVTFRGNYSPTNYDNDIGFRCAKSEK
jgi:formylglycine-generating enzyme required for sulfatase activity